MFNWKLFLDLAEELAQSEDEARRRTAISRAYYAVVGIARKKMKDVNPNVNLGYHENYWLEFKSQESRILRQIGEQGLRLRRKRNSADYHDSIPNLQKESESAIIEARRIMNSLELAK